MEMTLEVKALYQQLLNDIDIFGNIIIEEKKTSIHLKNRAAFAGVHPRKSYLILNIVSSEPIVSPRIMKTEQVSKSRFHNELKIEKAEDIDDELIKWLHKAFDLMQ
ncbi:MAG: DUF5655 domain-containing protein [Weeksellaceae bacterium]